MMKSSWKRTVAPLCIALALSGPTKPAKADFWGGDIPLLIQIVANTLEQLVRLKQIIQNGKDSLDFMRDVNQGIREAMNVMRTMNETLHPGVLSQFQTPEEMLRAVQEIYGMIPKTAEAKTQTFTDASVAEAVTLHNKAFEYADRIDSEAERIKDYARRTSPAASAKLTAQALGVLIHVSDQILRTNAAMLKVLSQNMALQNRSSKLNSEHFKMQYEGISSAMAASPTFKESISIKSNP